MLSVLQSLHTVPGIIGGLLSDDEGNVLAHSFPSIFDLTSLQGVSGGLNFNILGLHDATAGVKLLDLRFEHGRVIVKPMPKFSLLMLCEQNLNIQLLSISMNVAIKKLEKLVAMPHKPMTASPTTPQAQQAAKPATTAPAPKVKKPINLEAQIF
jgi:predicted regulator of Ras-like GTPase activity (Roadblock/LC7/MglB family)